MEKTIPNMQVMVKKRCLTEQMNKYQKYTGQSAGQKHREAAEKENCETVVRRRTRKTNQKIRPKSEVREKSEGEVWMDGDGERRRPRSYIEGARDKEFYVQTCRKPVRIF